MAARGELILLDGLLADVDGLLAVELLWHGEQLHLWCLFLLLLGFDKRHIAAPAAGGSSCFFLILPVQLVQVLFAQDDGLFAECLEEVVTVLDIVVFGQLVGNGQTVFLTLFL